MRLYPAIDILDGSAVRLTQGSFERRTTYASDPLDAALAWVEAGARQLHVVDLDGARAGTPVNLDVVARIARESGVEVQLGGGLRSRAAIEAAFDAGATRIVLGTAAFADPQLLIDALAAHGERIVVSVDVRGGLLATAGWTQTGELAAAQAVEELALRGVTRFVYTDVDRDGMLGGVDARALAAVADAVAGELLYSGGIGVLEDLRVLAALKHPSLVGVIVGKALYEGRFTITEAHEALCS